MFVGLFHFLSTISVAAATVFGVFAGILHPTKVQKTEPVAVSSEVVTAQESEASNTQPKVENTTSKKTTEENKTPSEQMPALTVAPPMPNPTTIQQPPATQNTALSPLETTQRIEASLPETIYGALSSLFVLECEDRQDLGFFLNRNGQLVVLAKKFATADDEYCYVKTFSSVNSYPKNAYRFLMEESWQLYSNRGWQRIAPQETGTQMIKTLKPLEPDRTYYYTVRSPHEFLTANRGWAAYNNNDRQMLLANDLSLDLNGALKIGDEVFIFFRDTDGILRVEPTRISDLDETYIKTESNKTGVLVSKNGLIEGLKTYEAGVFTRLNVLRDNLVRAGVLVSNGR